MKSKLLKIGGGFHTLALIIHILLIWGINSSPDLAVRLKASLQLFNSIVVVLLIYFVWVSFFRTRDLLTTELGEKLLLLMGGIYLMKIVKDVLLTGVNLLSPLFWFCLFAGFLHFFVFYKVRNSVYS